MCAMTRVESWGHLYPSKQEKAFREARLKTTALNAFLKTGRGGGGTVRAVIHKREECVQSIVANTNGAVVPNTFLKEICHVTPPVTP